MANLKRIFTKHFDKYLLRKLYKKEFGFLSALNEVYVCVSQKKKIANCFAILFNKNVDNFVQNGYKKIWYKMNTVSESHDKHNQYKIFGIENHSDQTEYDYDCSHNSQLCKTSVKLVKCASSISICYSQQIRTTNFGMTSRP